MWPSTKDYHDGLRQAKPGVAHTIVMSYTSPPIEKVFPHVENALSGLLHDGMSIMSGGFGLCGNAEACIEAIARSRVNNLTIISNNCGNAGQGLAVLLKNRQVTRVICSFVGGNPDLAELYMKGLVKVELSPPFIRATSAAAVSSSASPNADHVAAAMPTAVLSATSANESES